MATQFDIIRRQAEAAARNEAARAVGALRRDASLVNQASRWAGRALTQGEESLRKKGAKRRQGSPPSGETHAQQARPIQPSPDGYIRRSPVQPLHVAEGYQKRLLLRAGAVAALIAALCVGLGLLSRLGLLAW